LITINTDIKVRFIWGRAGNLHLRRSFLQEPPGIVSWRGSGDGSDSRRKGVFHLEGIGEDVAQFITACNRLLSAIIRHTKFSELEKK
jgi:hypothetical protein